MTDFVTGVGATNVACFIRALTGLPEWERSFTARIFHFNSAAEFPQRL
ncbi:MAG: hypothetical protein LUG95_03295 [Clostridiales bacterium]|nr:hypothetical protein [Clostridiales bacterium]